MLALRTSSFDEVLRQRPIRPVHTGLIQRCRHHHIIIRHHGCLAFSPNGSLNVSGQTSYTGDPTVPASTPASA